MDSIRSGESVCRCLFGPVDHDQLRRDLKQKLREVTEQASRRWNFNFHTDTPLPGRFQWEEVPANRAAVFYQDSATVADAVCAEEGCEEIPATNQENISSVSNTPKCPAEVTPARRRKRKLSSSSKANNARITDFFVKRKTSERRCSKARLLPVSSEAAPCRTIR